MRNAYKVFADSREVTKGSIFVAIKGINQDGHKYISQAVSKGTSLIIGEKNGKDLQIGDVPYLRVDDSRQALSILASSEYGNPTGKMKIIGVTGTDGKTTTASLIYWILKKSGRKVGLISTVSAKIGDRHYDTGFHTTNPEPLALQNFLAKMVKAKCEYAVLEVTSHGLDQERVYGVNFDIGILTNITHEHLDYHKTLQRYVEAKSKLFNSSNYSIINRKYANLITRYLKDKNKTLFYDERSLRGSILQSILDRFSEPYNLSNATAAVFTTRKLGISDGDIAKAVKTFPLVEGRMQEIKNELGIKIIIDFAHTPNALQNVLKVLKKQVQTGKRLITVFGCAGERDTKKRPMMARISTKLADVSVFTAEDPRHEKVANIFSQMMRGVRNKKAKVYEIEDRRKAISFAINKLAKKGDIVGICGKGHEKSMNFDGIEYPWSDKEAVNSALK